VHYGGAKPQSCIVENFCTTGGQSLLSLPGTVEKNFSSRFKCYNLTIHAVNFCEMFWTYSFSSLGQDLTIKSAKMWDKKLVGLLELETTDLECFSEKKGLNPLGVNMQTLNFTIPSLVCGCELLKVHSSKLAWPPHHVLLWPHNNTWLAHSEHGWCLRSWRRNKWRFH
jgi:hypothetical protein